MNIKLIISVVVASVALVSCEHYHVNVAHHSHQARPVVVKQVVHRPVVKKHAPKQVAHKPAKPHVNKPMAQRPSKNHELKPVANKRPNKNHASKPLAGLNRNDKGRRH